MAHLIVDSYADTLGMETRMHVLLPERLQGKARTLYLLHGMSDDEGTWMRRTAIDRYAEEKDLAVVMPDGGLGWYTDMHIGFPWFTYITQELPAICRSFFPNMSEKREDTFVAGLSMGGYGALKCALRAPETYCARGRARLLGGRLRPGAGHRGERKRPLRGFGPPGRVRQGAAQALHVVRHGGWALRPERAPARPPARQGLRPHLRGEPGRPPVEVLGRKDPDGAFLAADFQTGEELKGG